MTKSLPHITVSIGGTSDQSETSSDINLLSIGLGLYQAWLYLSVFGSGVLAMTSMAPSLGTVILASSFATQVFDSYFITVSVCLLLIAFTNQLLLRFYVSKGALICATALAVAGSVLAYLPAMEGLALIMAVSAGICMGLASSLMIVLWGTAFARFEFTTIILNTAIALGIGVVLYFAFIQWMRTSFSGAIAAVSIILSALLLWKLTPIPYNARHEIPIFRPLPVQPARFTTRVGAPTLLFGIVLGLLLFICIERVLANSLLSEQVIVGAAAIVSMGLIFIVSALISHDEAHWDMIFRILVPIVGLSIAAVPFLGGNWALLAEFLVICGYICMQTLMWIFFSNLAQEFRLSPIFVFGLGNCILSVGTMAGAYLGRFVLEGMMAEQLTLLDMGVKVQVSDALLLLFFALLLAYALLPRRREIRAIIVQGRGTEPGLSALQKSLAEAESSDSAAEDRPNEGAEEASSSAATPDEPMPEAEATQQETTTADNADQQAPAKHWFRDACEELADRYLLSRRESEVMFLLAKGHNASFIQEKLCISRSTAKTHINHIYKKLDIHTQQELLTMVDDLKPKD